MCINNERYKYKCIYPLSNITGCLIANMSTVETLEIRLTWLRCMKIWTLAQIRRIPQILVLPNFRTINKKKHLSWIPSLKLTTQAPENGWLEDETFPVRFGFFSRGLAVFVRENISPDFINLKFSMLSLSLIIFSNSTYHRRSLPNVQQLLLKWINMRQR